jgi:hypothetical protein
LVAASAQIKSIAAAKSMVPPAQQRAIAIQIEQAASRLSSSSALESISPSSFFQ